MGVTLIHGFCSTQQWLLPCFLGRSISRRGWTGTTGVTRVQRKRISRAERRREVRKSLADGTINPFLLRPRHLPYPLRKIYPYFEEESSQVPHLKKVHDQIGSTEVNSQWANSPSHDAWQKRASTKWSFPLGWGSRPERIFFKTFSPMLNFPVHSKMRHSELRSQPACCLLEWPDWHPRMVWWALSFLFLSRSTGRNQQYQLNKRLWASVGPPILARGWQLQP